MIILRPLYGFDQSSFLFYVGVCLLQVTLRQDPSCHRRKNLVSVMTACLLIVVGVFLFGLVLTQAIRIDLASAGQQEENYAPLCNVTRLSHTMLFGG